jgi:hypothetical protein
MPARDALSLNVVVGTIDQAAWSLFLNALFTAIAGPRVWTGLGVETARIGFQLAYDAAANPFGFMDWLTGAASCVVELGLQATRDVIAARLRNGPDGA